MKLQFHFNIPAECLENGDTSTFITVRAKRVFNSNVIDIHEMPAYLLGSIKNGLQLMAAIEKVVKEKFAAIDTKSLVNN